MNSEEDEAKTQDLKNINVETSVKQNDSQTTEQGNSLKVTKIQNKVYGEQLILNNNVAESNAKSALPAKPLVVVSNGTSLAEATTSSCTSTLDDGVSQTVSTTSVSSTFTSTTNVKPQITNTNQIKHKYAPNNANPNHQVHLNVSSKQNLHHNHATGLVINNSTSLSNASVHSSISIPNSATVLQNLSPSRTAEDVDIKNNVDYASEIEKCPSKVSCSSDSSVEVDCVWAVPRPYVSTLSTLNNIGDSIGSTSQGTCCFLRPNINGNREGAGPSGLQRMSLREQVQRRDSSSGNEGDMSDGEDYCIYTYKGNDNMVHVNQREEVNDDQLEAQDADVQCHSGRSSPEMDYLEMDFDPGPSCEQDTGDSDLASINEEIQNIVLDNIEPDPMLNDLSSGKVTSRQGTATVVQQPKQSGQNVAHSVQHQNNSVQSVADIAAKQIYPSPWTPDTSSSTPKWEATGLYRNMGCPLQESYGYHNTSGDLISPGDNRDPDSELWSESSPAAASESSNFNSRRVNLSSTLYHRMMAKKLMLNKQAAFNQSSDSNLETELCCERLDGLLPVEKVMLWSEQEATIKQVTQIATSACGATAAINALLALDITFSLEVLVKGVETRLREPGAPLPRYLTSRSLAGSTHKDLARGISLATNGAAVTKFFAFYPERKVSLSHWLHYWISRGAAPIATLNLQHCGEGCDIPDAWHHQMIFGVGQAGVYLTNPLQCLSEKLMWHQLVSPSVLLIRRADVLAHWNPNTDLTPLVQMDKKWRKLNVLGQVVNMVREAMSQKSQPSSVSTGIAHIRIPASYQAGITLVMCADSPTAAELLHAEQLPLL